MFVSWMRGRLHPREETTKSRRGQACEKVGQTRNVDLYVRGGYTRCKNIRPDCTMGPRDLLSRYIDDRCTDRENGTNRVTFTRHSTYGDRGIASKRTRCVPSVFFFFFFISILRNVPANFPLRLEIFIFSRYKIFFINYK